MMKKDLDEILIDYSKGGIKEIIDKALDFMIMEDNVLNTISISNISLDILNSLYGIEYEDTSCELIDGEMFYDGNGEFSYKDFTVYFDLDYENNGIIIQEVSDI